MTGLRLVLITRRFWPHIGGAEVIMSNLAVEFLRAGHRPVIVTAQSEPGWPLEVVHREVPVFRLPNPRTRGWGTLRYMSALSRWLRSRQNQIDAVCVSMLKHDAYVALGSIGGRRPVILRAEGGGSSGDCHWQETARFGSRIRRRCVTAGGVVAVSKPVHAELIAAGYDASRVHYIPNGVPVGQVRGADARRAARRALAEVNYDLTLPDPDVPVAVYSGRLDQNKGLADLVDAWAYVVAARPEARLWMVGEGPYREELYRRIQDQELVGRVLMPGTFDTMDEVLDAADLFVLPSYAEGLSLSILEAMAKGVPVVATNVPGNDTLVADGVTGRLIPPRDPPELAKGILESLRTPEKCAQFADAAYRQVRDHYDLTQTAQRHLKLIHRLIDIMQANSS